MQRHHIKSRGMLLAMLPPSFQKLANNNIRERKEEGERSAFIYCRCEYDVFVYKRRQKSTLPMLEVLRKSSQLRAKTDKNGQVLADMSFIVLSIHFSKRL